MISPETPTDLPAFAADDVRASLLSVGDELVNGVTVDTNTACLARELSSIGIRTVRHETVGDGRPDVEAALRRARQDVEVVVVSGGIGPTPDDLTRQALAAVAGVELATDQAWVDTLRNFWKQRGRRMPANNLVQATYPSGGELLYNPAGTAAGVYLAWDGVHVFLVPGVPKEMRVMADRHVLPRLRELLRGRGGRVLKARAIHTFGLGESDLAQRLGELLARGREPSVEVGTTASRGIVSVRAYARCPGEIEACETLDVVERRVRDVLGDFVFGVDDQTLPSVVARGLRDHPRQPMVSLAESCTGGLVAKLVTDVPGSSAHFHRGFVTYSNQAKIQMLGVRRETLDGFGAVSEQTVTEMARGARAREGHGVALAVSGIAGPGGGTHDKPVGTVCIALATPGKNVDPDDPQIYAHTFNFPGDRDTVRLRSAYAALTMLRLWLNERDPLTLWRT